MVRCAEDSSGPSTEAIIESIDVTDVCNPIATISHPAGCPIATNVSEGFNRLELLLIGLVVLVPLILLICICCCCCGKSKAKKEQEKKAKEEEDKKKIGESGNHYATDYQANAMA